MKRRCPLVQQSTSFFERNSTPVMNKREIRDKLPISELLNPQEDQHKYDITNTSYYDNFFVRVENHEKIKVQKAYYSYDMQEVREAMEIVLGKLLIKFSKLHITHQINQIGSSRIKLILEQRQDGNEISIPDGEHLKIFFELYAIFLDLNHKNLETEDWTKVENFLLSFESSHSSITDRSALSDKLGVFLKSLVNDESQLSYN